MSLHPTIVGEKKAWPLIILYGFLNQIQAQKRRGHLIKLVFIFLTALKQVGFIVLTGFKQFGTHKKKINITAVGLVFISQSQKMSNDFRKDMRERLLGNHCSQDATEAYKYKHIFLRKTQLVSKTKNFYVT